MPPKTKPDTETPEVDQVDATPSPDVDTTPVVVDAEIERIESFDGRTVRNVDHTTVPITFSVVHTTRDGITHGPDTTAQLSVIEARHVLYIGHGRHADASTEAGTADDTEEQVR